MSKQKTVFVLIPPAHGHMNPIVGTISELVKNNVRVIFYSNENKRDVVERTGAQFRAFVHPTFDLIDHSNAHKQKDHIIYDVMSNLLNFSYILMPSLLADVQRDEPDLIIYDPLFMPARYLLEVVKKNKSIKQPKSLMFISSLANNKAILEQMKLIKPTFTFGVFMFILFLKQLFFNIYFGIWVNHPLEFFMSKNENMNIVAVFPELQPMRELFDDSYKLVGPCIMEKVRDNRVDDTKLKQIMDHFKPVDDKSQSDVNNNQEKRLVYASLGTVFNEAIDVIETIIDSIRQYSKNPNRKIASEKLTVVVSLGDKIYEQVQEKIQKGVYQIPDNVFLYRQVPQIEILKRASLFITHAGQNSASEAIQYAVPVICIPISADQPLVSRVLCDELKLGIRMDPLTVDAASLGDSIEEILTTPKYQQTICELSKVSRKYNGVEESTRLVLEFLNNDLNQDKKID